VLKKYLPGIIVAILLYLLFQLPARLLEHWFLSEVLEQVEAKGWSFLILWVMPLLAVISLTAIGYYLWNLIKGYKTKVQGEYQPQSVSKIVIKTHGPSVIVGKAGGLVYDLNTNKSTWQHEYTLGNFLPAKVIDKDNLIVMYDQYSEYVADAKVLSGD